MKLIIICVIQLLVLCAVVSGFKRRIKTAKCKYTFVVNEMNMANCPNAIQPPQADREPEKSFAVNPLLPLPNLPSENSTEVKSWLRNMEKQLYNELKKSDEINSTLTKHESTLNRAEQILAQYESNFTSIFRMLRFLESSLKDQYQMNKKLDNKLSGVMLDVVEVNNVLSKKVVLSGGRVTSKDIEVKSVSKLSSCSISPESVVFRDCSDVMKKHNVSGVYYVTPTYASCPIPVWCDHDTTSGGWLVILRRESGTLNFNRLWDEYKHGFGSIMHNFYLGNDNIFLLSNQRHYELRVDLWDFEGNRVFALYKTFKIDGERDNYKITIHSFEGSARDSLKKHDRSMFSTPDRDNDGYQGYNCAREWEAGWWFNNCWFGFLTGPYYNKSNVRYRGISWNEWKHEQLAKTEMKIRPSRLAPPEPEMQHTNSGSSSSRKP